MNDIPVMDYMNVKVQEGDRIDSEGQVLLEWLGSGSSELFSRNEGRVKSIEIKTVVNRDGEPRSHEPKRLHRYH